MTQPKEPETTQSLEDQVLSRMLGMPPDPKVTARSKKKPAKPRKK